MQYLLLLGIALLLIGTILVALVWHLQSRMSSTGTSPGAPPLNPGEKGSLGSGVGTIDGFQVRKEQELARRENGTYLVTRFIARGVPAGLSISRPLTIRGPWRVTLSAGGDEAVGDPAFDDVFVVRGDPLLVSVALGQEARAALLAWAAQGPVWVQSGEVGREEVGVVTDPGSVRAGLERVAAVARALTAVPGGEFDRLATIIREDPAAGVRARALALLPRAGSGDIAAVARAAIGDPDLEVRIRAALLLRDPQATRALIAAGGLSARAEVALLASLEDRAVLPELLRALTHEDPEVRGHAAAAIGAVGGRDEVVALLALAEREVYGDGLRRAKAAIAAIQARLGAVEAGRLAIADEGDTLAGAVSEAGPGGAVSIAAQAGRREGAGG